MTIPTFPTLIGQAFPFIRKPLWQTLTLSSVSGRRARYPLRNIPQYQFSLVYDLLRSGPFYSELQSLMGFYNLMRGSYGVFQFNYADDNTATNNLFGVGDGSSTTFQLMRSYGGVTEPVFAPVTTAVYVNGTQAANYSLSPTGMVTFTTPPSGGAQLTWTGTFNWLCRFDDDSVEFSKFADQFWEVQKITFTTEIL